MKIYNKGKFTSALIATILTIACLIAYFITNHMRFIIAFPLALIYAGFEYYSAFSKSSLLSELEQNIDERDIFITMKTSRTTILILSKLLFCACLISIILYAMFHSSIYIIIMITLCIVICTLFVVMLFTNIYYEKHD